MYHLAVVGGDVGAEPATVEHLVSTHWVWLLQWLLISSSGLEIDSIRTLWSFQEICLY